MTERHAGADTHAHVQRARVLVTAPTQGSPYHPDELAPSVAGVAGSTLLARAVSWEAVRAGRSSLD